MAKTKLKRQPRTTIETSAGEISLRPLNAVDVSELVKMFDLETVELATMIINHVQAGKPVEELLINAELYTGLINAIPDLICNSINLCAGGDSEDLEAIRELPLDDLGLVSAKLIAISLERIGGLGKFLQMLTEMVSTIQQSLQSEVDKKQELISASDSGDLSPS